MSDVVQTQQAQVRAVHHTVRALASLDTAEACQVVLAAQPATVLQLVQTIVQHTHAAPDVQRMVAQALHARQGGVE